MKGDISPSSRKVPPYVCGFLPTHSEMTMPRGSFSTASNPKIGYLLPFPLNFSILRHDSYRTNVAIQEEAT